MTPGPADRHTPQMDDARSFILVRHGRSDYNVRGVLNGDPSVPVRLTDEGVDQCRAVAAALRDDPVTLAVCTRFPRTRESLGIILAGRDVPVEVYPEFDDVRLGVFEGRPVDEFRAWRHEHGPAAAPPGGESRLDTLRRYADGYARLLRTTHQPCTLAVVHDVTIRMMVNAVAGDNPIDGPVTHIPNATPYRFTAAQLSAGLERMRARADGDLPLPPVPPMR